MNNGSFDSSKDLWPKPKGRPASIVIPIVLISFFMFFYCIFSLFGNPMVKEYSSKYDESAKIVFDTTMTLLEQNRIEIGKTLTAGDTLFSEIDSAQKDARIPLHARLTGKIMSIYLADAHTIQIQFDEYFYPDEGITVTKAGQIYKIKKY